MKKTKLSLHASLFGERDPSAVIAFSRDRTFLLKDLQSHIIRLARFLTDFQGEKVAVCLNSAWEFTIAFAATVYAGKIPVLLGNFTEKTILQDQDKYHLLLTTLDQETISLTNRNAYCPKDQDWNFQEPDPDSAIIMYTSGSTGTAKEIRKTLRIMEKESELFRKTFGDKLPEDCYLLATVPPFHMYGLTFRIFFPLLNHIPMGDDLIHYTEELCSPPGIAGKPPVILVSSPAFLSNIDTDLTTPDFRLVLSAGAPLSADVARSFWKWSGTAVLEIYGSTETGIMAYHFNCGNDELFTPFPEISFHEENKQFYITTPLCLQPAPLDDILEFSGACFRIKGRSDRILKIAEKRISLNLIEKYARELENIEDAAALGIEKKNRVFIGLAVATPLASSLNRNEQLRYNFIKMLRAHMKDYLPGVALPRYIRIVEHFPVNTMGKKIYAKLRELFYDKS